MTSTRLVLALSRLSVRTSLASGPNACQLFFQCRDKASLGILGSGEPSKLSTTHTSDRDEYTVRTNLRPSGVMATLPNSSKGRAATVWTSPPFKGTIRIFASVTVSPRRAVRPR